MGSDQRGYIVTIYGHSMLIKGCHHIFSLWCVPDDRIFLMCFLRALRQVCQCPCPAGKTQTLADYKITVAITKFAKAVKKNPKAYSDNRMRLYGRDKNNHGVWDINRPLCNQNVLSTIKQILRDQMQYTSSAYFRHELTRGRCHVSGKIYQWNRLFLGGSKS